jgi:hypothetical protein
MSDSELAAKITEAGGRVFIGFKASGAAAGVDERGRVLVGAGVVADAKSQLRALGVILDFEFIDMPSVVARMSAMLLPQIRQNPEVEYVEPIFPGVFASQETTWNVQRVQAPAAWSYSMGNGAKLLILDSGIDNTHPDLAPAVIQTCVPNDDGLDRYGHGTWVAGIAAAVNNAIGIVGVASGVSLWTSKIATSSNQPDPGYAACGVQFGRLNHVAVINMSWGVTPCTALTDQINAAYYQDGIVMVAGPANNSGGPVDYPSSLGSVIAVSSTDINNNLSPSAPVDPKIELAAPGVHDTTTCLGGAYCDVSGTSFSAPHVAAAAALLKAYNPSQSSVDIRSRLDGGAIDLGASGRDAQFGYGLLNIPAAITYVLPLGAQVTGPTVIQIAGNYTWTASVSGGTGSYSYQWDYQNAGSSNWISLGTGPSQDRYVDGSTPNFTLRATVTSGSQTQAPAINVYWNAVTGVRVAGPTVGGMGT